MTVRHTPADFFCFEINTVLGFIVSGDFLRFHTLVGSKGSREKKRYALTAEELILIMNRIRDTGFFGLEK